MAVYASGSIRFSGLGQEGTNFDEMIEKLYKIESRQATQLMSWKKDWQTRLDAFKQVRTELMTLQSALTKLNSMNKFMAKTAVSSDDKIASATAGANSVDGAYTLEVNNLAKAYTWSQHTGLYNKTDVICTDPNGGKFTYTYKGTTRTIDVPPKTTAEGLVKLINNDSKNPGARAQLIQSGDGVTFQMFGRETGLSNTLVIRDTSGLTLQTALNTATAKYDDSQINRVQLNAGFEILDSTVNLSDPNAVKTWADGQSINTTGENKTFKFTYDGTSYTVPVADGMSLGALVDEVNKRVPGLPAPLASLEARNGKAYFTLNRDDTTYSFSAGTDPTEYDRIITSGTAYGYAESLNTSTNTDLKFQFSITNQDNNSIIGGAEKSVTITPGMTVDQFMTALQKEVGSYGRVTQIPETTIDSSGNTIPTGKFSIAIVPIPKEHRVTVEDGTLDAFAYEIPTDNNWSVVKGENAEIKVNGWPGGNDNSIWLESASNSIAAGTVVEDISFTLLKTGTTTITTGTDKAKIRENIESFVEAVNNFRVVLDSLTSVDEEKQTYDPEYADSQFDMQKGSVLTGNYGIQTLDSRLNSAIAGSGVGFLPRENDEHGYYLSGDYFNALSQIGIKTCADEGSTFYGLLEINYIPGDKGTKSLDQALDEDPMAVARLFAASNEGFTDSASFGFNSQIATVTKAGNYSVSYTCTVDGKIDKAWINGEEATVNNETFQITSVSGASKGLMLDIYPHSLVAGQTTTGTVSLRQGKVNELISMMEGSEGLLGTSGTLRNLERNYQQIIDNIEAKITKEDERLAKWERTQINKFARLDAVLAKYNAINDGLQSQIAQLSSK